MPGSSLTMRRARMRVAGISACSMAARPRASRSTSQGLTFISCTPHPFMIGQIIVTGSEISGGPQWWSRAAVKRPTDRWPCPGTTCIDWGAFESCFSPSREFFHANARRGARPGRARQPHSRPRGRARRLRPRERAASDPIRSRYLLARSRSPELIEPADVLEFTLDFEPVGADQRRCFTANA